ncbi:bifunctional (p)ppGpp synthetase/guanosine-3',5'-bis(diphosphate) 3'-pyrophosphohydrolase [Candidatus Nomurabacteria bacterium]|nr:bifunctional (p)ppGpp synthetase/guanosine-3',5'-bis(diphosphate) 3'-pyrophosphohydrolase [Candidatus Nomurabacteria bacterium]
MFTMTDKEHIQEILDLTKRKETKEEEELIEKAYYFAKHAHEGQKRASGEPYFNHVLATAKNLARYEMDALTISAGFLHDTVEDTDVTEKDIKEEFGEEILKLVEGVTKLGTLKYRGVERHVESLRKFMMAAANDPRVIMIKLADRLHNLETLQYVRKDKQQRIALESLEVYAPLAARLSIGKLKGEIEDAAFPFAYPKEYKEITEILNEKKNEYKKELEKVHEDLKDLLELENIDAIKIDYRVKHRYSFWKKLNKHNGDISRIYDIIALRVIVKDIATCYRVMGIVHSHWKPLPGRIKDYIALPKTNGYQSLHTTIFTGNGHIAEIQIRTPEMHGRAEYGIASHYTYKEESKNKKKDDKFQWFEEFKNLGKEHEEPVEDILEDLKMDTFSDRIFVFTPKGDVIDLPEGSCSIDFAYAVHSDLGDTLSSVKINGKMEKIFTPLKSHDIVEVFTSKNSKPTSKWLSHAKTQVARKRINSYLKQNSLMNKFLNISRKK